MYTSVWKALSQFRRLASTNENFKWNRAFCGFHIEEQVPFSFLTRKMCSRSFSKEFLTRSLRPIGGVYVEFSPSKEEIPFIEGLRRANVKTNSWWNSFLHFQRENHISQSTRKWQVTNLFLAQGTCGRHTPNSLECFRRPELLLCWPNLRDKPVLYYSPSRHLGTTGKIKRQLLFGCYIALSSNFRNLHFLIHNHKLITLTQ